jgi:uncharacterized membrane protein
MTEPLKPYRDYITEEILAGKAQQDIFNDVVTRYDIKIHEAAEAIRKTPTLDKRIKNKKLNIALILSMVLSMILGLVYRLNNFDGSYAALFPGILGLMLLYGLINYKYPAHFIASILLTVLSAILAVLLVFDFDLRLLLELVFTLCATVLAYIVNARLSSEYIYHRQKVQNDPLLRIDSVTFIK